MKIIPSKPAGLLVSVRSAEEASAAVVGGADLIDVKEPSRGPLGQADAHTIMEVVDAVAGRVPVSAALGEWVDWDGRPIPSGLAFVKWGLANIKESAQRTAARVWECAKPAGSVLVAYADDERAGSPRPELLSELACKLGFAAFLIDTAIKDGSTLLDWTDLAALCRIRHALSEAGVRFAVAGALDLNAIRLLSPVRPDWFAVRGAACNGGREGRISAERVRALREVIADQSQTEN